MANQDFSWHLAILHFALMLDNANRLGVLAIANEVDGLGSSQDDRAAFHFFRRTSAEVCEAILRPNKPVLRQYSGNISRESTIRS